MSHADGYVDEEAPTEVFVRVASARPAGESVSNREVREMLTVREAADVLRVNVKTIHAMLADGLPHLRPSSRIIRIERSVLISWRKVA
jgi:excisionase family DNA binding protein